MKTLLFTLLICFSLSGYSQDYKHTEFRIYFEGCYEITQIDDLKNSWFVCDQMVYFETNTDELEQSGPFGLIVATKTTRATLILMPSDKPVEMALWEGKDLVLGR